MNNNSKPIKSTDRDSTGEYYWKCPTCGNRVGGYIIIGSGEDDWGYVKNKFCCECGTKIDWRYV